MSKDKYIIVNATALEQSGALSILRQFVDNIPEDNIKWLIFIPVKVIFGSTISNIRLESVSNVKSMPKRLWWDSFGLKRWLRKNNIEPIAAISLQNTGFKVEKKVPTFIYYHQPIPFFPNTWNPLKKNQRTFWFYKYIYPLFVRLFLKNDTQIFVQLNFIRDGFVDYFSHPYDKVKIFSPSVIKRDLRVRDSSKTKGNDNLTLLYPAMPHFYKNHRIIDEALSCIKERNDIEVLFTIDPNNIDFSDTRIKLIGLQPHERINTLYEECDALLFPSYIETFGLPLLEAAMTGMPIIAADLPYAREVLDGYEGVSFVKHDDPKAWADEIKKIKKGKRYRSIDISKRPGWKELFEEIEKVIR